MVVFFVKNNENTYPKGRALMQMYRVVPITKRGNCMIYLCFVAELKMNYLKKSYIVTMGSFQMAILLMFNSWEKVTYREVVTHTQLSDKEMIKQVQSLIDAKLIVTEVSVQHVNISLMFKNP